MADLTAFAAETSDASGQANLASVPDAENAERTRLFFLRNAEARRQLNSHTKKQSEKRFKLREDFGTNAYLFDEWRGEQSATHNLSSVPREPPRSHTDDSLLVTRVEAMQIDDGQSIASARTSSFVSTGVPESNSEEIADKLEKSEE